MYRVAFCVMAALILAPAVTASAVAMPPPGVARPGDFMSVTDVQKFMYEYRGKPSLARVPAAVKALSRLGTLKDPEGSGIYVGFIAGVIGSNPRKAEDIINKTLPLTPQDQWVLVRAIAYSGHPDWKGLLSKFVERMPARAVMAHEYISGSQPTLDEMALEEPDKSFFQKVNGYFHKPPPGKPTIDKNPELLDVMWGYYFATGSYKPILRIISMLPWSKDRDSVEKLTLGSTAKYTLANYAAREPDLLDMLKRSADQQPKNVEPILREVIHAAETVNVAALHREQTAAVEKLKREGPEYKKELSTWGQVGVGAIAVGCVAAAALGQVEVGIPCVIGGSVSSGALSLWQKQEN
ncbi:MAG TPA: hypothetical protein VK456_08545 [Xanthobacteraceae bacterium]|nr:hypothetical protein [Xanthobacteraceae bacterium]